MGRIAAILALLLPLAAAPPGGEVQVDVDGLRNQRGLLHVCITKERRHFLDCSGDPSAIKKTVPASTRQLHFSGVAPGLYAVTLIHDENANKRLDKWMGIPREGFGFSRNPTIRFGAPKFEAVDIELGSGFTRTRVRMQYLL